MAAQEKAKQTVPQPATSAPVSTDLLDSFDAPADVSESAPPPPPPFDMSLLPQQDQLQEEPPPPAFDASMLPPAPCVIGSSKPTSQSTVTWDPNIPAPPPPPNMMMMTGAAQSASAPVFEDLLDPMEDQQKMPPPTYEVTPVAPPTLDNNTSSSGGRNRNSEGLDQEAIDAILGIEGLSDEEKAALIAEQEKIMVSIEQEKRNKAPISAAAARADAFEQRSHAAAVQAIGGGGGGATSANRTDTSHTVSTVSTADDVAAASQMAADMELAEQLQKEEYKRADKAEQQQQQKTRSASTAAAPTSKSSGSKVASPESSSWMDWLGLSSPAAATTTTRSSGATPAVTDRSFAQRPLERGEIGVSLPPGASRNNTALAMAPAYTGEEDDVEADANQFSPSRGEGEEDMSGGGGGARIAKQQPLFSYVADSISTAANSLYNAGSTDDEGNLHGVDTSGLLAMSQAGRESNNNNQQRPM